MLQILKKKIFWFMLISIVLVFIIGFSLYGYTNINKSGNIISTAFAPVQNFFTMVSNKAGGFFYYFADNKNTKIENERLKTVIGKLENENKELQECRDINRQLKEILNIKNRFTDLDFIGANIIGGDIGNWFSTFIIDKGSNEGILNNQCVITGQGLVGRVIESGLTTSKVITLLDADCIVSARISKTRDLVIVKGDVNLKNKSLCRMDYIPPDTDLAIGDIIETSGMGGIFPKGIIIGKVKEIKVRGSELTKYALIEPAVNFKRLEEVSILRNKNM